MLQFLLMPYQTVPVIHQCLNNKEQLEGFSHRLSLLSIFIHDTEEQRLIAYLHHAKRMTKGMPPFYNSPAMYSDLFLYFITSLHLPATHMVPFIQIQNITQAIKLHNVSPHGSGGSNWALYGDLPLP